MINLVFLPANNAFAFVLGRDLSTASMFRVDGEDLFFRSRVEAEAALKRHGLTLKGNEVVAV